MADDYAIKGLDDVLSKLEQLKDEGPIRNALNRSLRKGAAVIRDDARERALRLDDPDTKEAIHKNIVYSNMSLRRLRREGNAAGVRVGVMGGARPRKDGSGLPGGATWYWRLIEFGTSKVKATPFMRTAMETSAQKAFDAIGASADAELTKEIKKIR